MAFERLSEGTLLRLAALQRWQSVLTRAELAAQLARLRIRMHDSAEREIRCDPWFRSLDEGAQVGILETVTSLRANDMQRLSESLVWIAIAPGRISGLAADIVRNGELPHVSLDGGAGP